jgi:hypothetical protein
MLPAYRTAGEAFAIPKFELTPQDVDGFLDRIGKCIFPIPAAPVTQG